MADSTSPEQRNAAAPSALTARIDHPPDVAIRPADHAVVIRRPQVPARRPLPDAVAIRSVAIPDAAPPYDGALAATVLPATVPGSPAASAEDAEIIRAIAAVTDLIDGGRACLPRPGQSQFTGHWPSQFAQVLAETLAGSRPPNQLAPWTTQQTRRRINQLGQLLSTAHRPRVKRVIVTSPAGGVLEMTVIVGLGTRVRALAVRLERTSPGELTPSQQPGRPTAPQGWICTAIEAA